MSDKEENCECGLKEDGTWSEEVFDRYGCSCEEYEDEDIQCEGRKNSVQ